MFKLNEEKLREALRTDDEYFEPIAFDDGPDELNSIVDRMLNEEIIECERAGAMMSIYPLAIGQPDPVLAVGTSEGPVLLGPEVSFEGTDSTTDAAERTVTVARGIVEDANALYGSLTTLIEEAQAPLKDIARSRRRSAPGPRDVRRLSRRRRSPFDRIALQARQGLQTDPV